MSNYLVTCCDGDDNLQSAELTEQGAIDTATRWASSYTDVVIWKRHATVERVITHIITPAEEN